MLFNSCVFAFGLLPRFGQGRGRPIARAVTIRTDWTTTADQHYRRPMIKILTWFIWIWFGAAVLLNIVGSLGMIFMPSWLEAWLRATESYPVFSAVYLFLEVILILVAVWAINLQEKLWERSDWKRAST